MPPIRYRQLGKIKHCDPNGTLHCDVDSRIDSLLKEPSLAMRIGFYDLSLPSATHEV